MSEPSEFPSNFEPKTNNQYFNALRYASEFVYDHVGTADIAIVLGTGLKYFTERLTNVREVVYDDIPFMPITTVSGHSGKVVTGDVGEHRVLCFAGRVHGYEGYFSHQLTYIANLSGFLNCKYLILTNAAGGAIQGMQKGDIMLITDHLNFTNRGPLDAYNNDRRFGVRHLDTDKCYSPYLKDVARKVSTSLGHTLWEGSYCWTPGPTYETPKETFQAMELGAGSFGMSTIPEVLAAASLGIEVLAMSLVTNLAAGITSEILNHEEVSIEGKNASKKIEELVEGIINTIHGDNLKSSDGDHIVKQGINMDEEMPCFPLVKEAPKLPGENDMKEAVEVLAATNLGHSVPPVAFMFLFNGIHHELFNKLTKQRELSYSDIPHMPQYSLSARRGRLLFGTCENGARCVNLFNHHLDGLHAIESYFLLAVLQKYGIKHVNFIFEGASTSDSEKTLEEGQLIVMEDYINKSWNNTVKVLGQFVPQFGTFKTMYNQEVRKASHSIFGYAPEEVILAGVEGPSLPTPNERKMLKQLGADLWTITSLSPLDCAATLLMHHTFLCYTYNYHQPNFQYSNYIEYRFKDVTKYSKFFFEALTARHLVSCISSQFLEPRDEYSETIKELRRKHAAEVKGLEHNLTLPFTNKVSQLDEEANKLKKMLKTTFGDVLPHVAIVVGRSSFDNLIESFEVLARFTFTPETDGLMTQSPPVVCFAKEKVSGKPVLIVKGMIRAEENLLPSSPGVPVRILALTGMTHFIFLPSVISVDEGLECGDIALITDHVNFNAKNPLTGKNVDEWGDRFIDLQHVYSGTINDLVAKGLEKQGVKTKKVEALWMSTGKPYCSAAEVRVAKAMSVEVITKTGVPEAIICHHMKKHKFVLKCSVIGLVHFNSLPKDFFGLPMEPSTNTIETMEKGLGVAIAGAVAEL